MTETKEIYIGTAKINRSASVCLADLEPVVGQPPLEAKADTRFDTLVRITITCYRIRYCDCDGISGKAAIDGLVQAGVLLDDNPKCVEEVRFRQVKVKTKCEEKTVIEIEEVMP